MRMGRLCGAVDWKHAGGEFVLIVVGIVVALASSDWQSGRADRRTELAVLRELRTALSADLDTLEYALDRVRRNEARLDVLYLHVFRCTSCRLAGCPVRAGLRLRLHRPKCRRIRVTEVPRARAGFGRRPAFAHRTSLRTKLSPSPPGPCCRTLLLRILA